MENKVVFIVEFAKKSDIDKSYTYGDRRNIYVVARDYNEAVHKATMYIESKLKSEHKILAEDGSLNNAEPDIYKPISVKIINEEIVW